MADYDPSDPHTPIPWAQMTAYMPWLSRPQTNMTLQLAAAVRMLYGAPFALSGRPPWSPAWNPGELPVEEQRIILLQEFRSAPTILRVDERLLRALDQNPERILSLPWRQFEELIATLLEGFGYEVNLSPVGPDCGVDIFADRMTAVGPELVLVQCKRLGPGKKVGQPVVKQFCMDIEDRRATRGLIATTSTFTRVALKYIDWKKHRVSGADRAKVQEWIHQRVGERHR